jgi:cytochrome c peroxidase
MGVMVVGFQGLTKTATIPDRLVRRIKESRVKPQRYLFSAILFATGVCLLFGFAFATGGAEPTLDHQLTAVLHQVGFTGRVGSSIEARIGRPIDRKLANLGRLLWFDKVHSLHQDNTCGGCHSPTNGFGDTQPMAIGIQSNNLVGPHRVGPRNQRRTPLAANTAFYAAMMWNGRFNSISGDPFDVSQGFIFPSPEGTTRFPPNDKVITFLSQAQGEMPPTELTEAAGYTGTRGTISRAFDQFDDGLGLSVPLPDASGSRNDPIRKKVLSVLNNTPAYRELFAEVFPEVRDGAPIDFNMFGKAIAEFEFTLVFADAPLDQFSRGDHDAMTESEKRGALLFFGKAGCVQCHAVAGKSNEMFTDFKERVAGIPQIAPFFGVGKGNTIFDGPGQNEDFGMEQITNDPADRYKFRTAPLRNLAVSPGFFHNGSYLRLEDAIRHHLDTYKSARGYNPVAAGLPRDLSYRLGPIEPVLARLDPLLQKPAELREDEVDELVRFVRDGLHDPRVDAKNLCKLVPDRLPSGLQPLEFEACSDRD